MTIYSTSKSTFKVSECKLKERPKTSHDLGQHEITMTKNDHNLWGASLYLSEIGPKSNHTWVNDRRTESQVSLVAISFALREKNNFLLTEFISYKHVVYLAYI